jgi:hypothetical protein
MSLTYTRLNEVWTKVSSAMEKMFNFQSVTRNEYMALYKSVFII